MVRWKTLTLWVGCALALYVLAGCACGACEGEKTGVDQVEAYVDEICECDDEECVGRVEAKIESMEWRPETKEERKAVKRLQKRAEACAPKSKKSNSPVDCINKCTRKHGPMVDREKLGRCVQRTRKLPAHKRAKVDCSKEATRPSAKRCFDECRAGR